MALENVVNLADVQEETKKAIDKNFETFSYLGKLGSTMEAFGTTRLDVLRSTGAVTLQEGETKKLTPMKIDRITFAQGKTLAAVPLSTEAIRNSDGNQLLTKISAALTSDVIRGMDFAILNGKNTADGSTISWLDKINIAKNSQQVDGSKVPTNALGQLTGYSILDAQYELAPVDASIALTDTAYKMLSRDRNYQNAGIIYNDMNTTGTFSLDGQTAQLVKGLSYDNYTQSKKKSDLVANDLFSIMGDFSKIHLAIDGIDTRAASEGTFGGINLLETNTNLVLAEIFWKIAVEDVSEFVTTHYTKPTGE